MQASEEGKSFPVMMSINHHHHNHTKKEKKEVWSDNTMGSVVAHISW